MDDIANILNIIKTAIYGRDMRQAIHDGIKLAHDRIDNLGIDLDAEITNRQNDVERIDNEIGTLNGKLDALEAADEEIGGEIGRANDQLSYIDDQLKAEIRIREQEDAEIRDEFRRADSDLSDRLSPVEATAHTHENKDILDGIDADRVLKWDEGSEGEVTLAEYLEHLAEAERQFGMLWGLLGMTVYDGGIFGMAQIDIPLDGGSFDDTEFTPLDCGGFEPYVIPSGGVGTVVDGGTY